MAYFTTRNTHEGSWQEINFGYKKSMFLIKETEEAMLLALLVDGYFHFLAD